MYITLMYLCMYIDLHIIRLYPLTIVSKPNNMQYERCITSLIRPEVIMDSPGF